MEWGRHIGSDNLESRVLLTGESSTAYAVDDEDRGLDGKGEERGIDDKEEERGLDGDEQERGLDGDDEDCGLDGGRCSVWSGGWVDGWNGRRLASRNGRCDAVLSGGSVGGWDFIRPRSSNRGTPPMPSLNWYNFCKLCNEPQAADSQYSTAHSIHHDHHGYILNGSSDTVGFGGGEIDRGEIDHRPRTSFSRRQRPRIVRGTEWF